MNFGFFPRGQDAKQRQGRDAAGTRAEQIAVGPVSDFAHQINGVVQHADVSFQSPFALRRGWIAPTDGEHLNPLFHRIFNQAFIRGQVKNVEAVNLWWDDEQWSLVDIFSSGTVLN